jgi:hypothetical protein
MNQNKQPVSDDPMTERGLSIGALFVAIGLLSFYIAYLVGRDIGSVFFH